MRERKNTVIEIVLLGALGTFALLCLAAPQLLRNREPAPLLSLSVLLRDTDTTNWTVARQGMEQAADELGAELRFLTLTVQNDSQEQEEILRREAEGGADGLIAVPADAGALHATIGQLVNPPPMVTLENDMEGDVGMVSPDNREVGSQLAKALLTDWRDGQVVLLDNSAACPEVAQRLEGALDTLTEAGVSAITMTALPEDGGAMSWMQWVMTFEASATRQAAERKEAEGQTFALYGVGSSTTITAQLERGNITAIAAWSDYAAGYLAVRQAVQAVREGPQALDPLPFSIVRGEDIYAPENQKLLFPVMSSSGR